MRLLDRLPRSRHSFFRQSGLILGGSLLSVVGKLIAIWIVARFHGAVVQGALGLAVAQAGFGAVVLACGLDYANAFIVGRAPARENDVRWNSLWLAAASLLISPIWAYLFARHFPQVLIGIGSARITGILLLGFATSAIALSQTLQATAIGHQRFDLVAKASMASGLAWVVVALASARASYLVLLAGWAVAQLASPLLYVLLSSGHRSPRGVDRDLLGEQLRYGVRTLPGGLARSMNMRAALAMISTYLSAVDVGVFSLMLSISETLLYLPTALGQVVLGRVSRRVDSGHRDVRLYLWLGGVGVAASTFVMLAGTFLLRTIFGAEYARGAMPLGVLFLAMTAHAVGLLEIHRLYGTGRPASASAAQGVALALTFACGMLLIPRAGLLGAAASMFITYIGFALFLLTRPTGLPAREGMPDVVDEIGSLP